MVGYTVFARVCGTLTKIDDLIGNKTNLSNVKNSSHAKFVLFTERNKMRN